MKYAQIVKATNDVIAEYSGIRLTIRQIYYRLVSPPYQLFANNIKSYKSLVNLLTKAREKGDVDWRKIEDRRRHIIGGEEGYWNPKDFVGRWMSALRELGDYYARRRWSTQPKYLEVWVEKEALASLFEQASSDWKVYVFPTVGYSSLTMFMEAVTRFAKIPKPITVLDFRDHDPSGIDMTRDVQERLERYGADVEIKRIALTIDQVKELDLAPNPTKIADTRTPKYVELYGDECWELDAYPPDQLSKLIYDSIAQEIDTEEWEAAGDLEKKEKEKIQEALSESDDLIDEIEENLTDAFKDEED